MSARKVPSAAFPWRWAALWVAAAGVLGLLGAWSLPPDSHEVRPALAASQMLREGRWIVPQANGEPRLEKPPLGPWLIAASHVLLGGAADEPVTPLAARLPSILAGAALPLIAMGLAWLTGAAVAGAITAGGLCATSLGLLTYSHSARPEMLYAACSAAALLAALALIRPGSGAARTAAQVGAMAIALTGALLAKGPFLPLFLSVGALATLVLQRRSAALRRALLWLPAWLTAAGAVGLWVALVLRQRPEALEFWRHEMFDRTGGAGRWWLRPLAGYYLYATPALVLPWIALLPAAVLDPLRRRPAQGTPAEPTMARTLWGAIAGTVFFLSFSEGRHAYYMLPALPALCALMGAYGVAALRRLTPSALRSLTVAHAVALAALTLAVAAISLGSAPAGQGAVAWGFAAAALLTCWKALRTSGNLQLVQGRLAMACWLAFAAAGVGHVGWSGARRARWDFARHAAAIAQRLDLPILARGADPWLLAYAADRVVEPVSRDELAKRTAERTPFLVLLKRSARARLPAASTATLLQSDSFAVDDEPLALVVVNAPAASPSKEATLRGR
ncbi:MAG: hypothetical protein D6824_05740 [Planctomycetota bacterium]|nr:MAG: hypothetical protein D6824_05740 [Planctomycetota bacterium]